MPAEYWAMAGRELRRSSTPGPTPGPCRWTSKAATWTSPPRPTTEPAATRPPRPPERGNATCDLEIHPEIVRMLALHSFQERGRIATEATPTCSECDHQSGRLVLNVGRVGQLGKLLHHAHLSGSRTRSRQRSGSMCCATLRTQSRTSLSAQAAQSSNAATSAL